MKLYKTPQVLLNALNKKGYKVAIVTSKNKSTAIRALELLGIKDYFDVIVTSDDP